MNAPRSEGMNAPERGGDPGRFAGIVSMRALCGATPVIAAWLREAPLSHYALETLKPSYYGYPSSGIRQAEVGDRLPMGSATISVGAARLGCDGSVGELLARLAGTRACVSTTSESIWQLADRPLPPKPGFPCATPPRT